MSVSFKQLTEYLTECLNQESLANLHFELLHKCFAGDFFEGEDVPFCFLDKPIDFENWKDNKNPSVARVVELGQKQTKEEKYVLNTYVIGYPIFRFNKEVSKNNWETNVYPVFY